MNEPAPGANPFSEYDRLAHDNHWYPEALFGLAYEYLSPGERLLDVGIGTGLASEPFARFGAAVSGFDADPQILEICREKSFAVDLALHDLQDISWPYGNASFDHVIACGVLHFVRDLEPVFGEISRLLRPGGSCTFTTKAAPEAAGATAANEAVVSEAIQGTTLYLHPPAYVYRLMAESGLEPAKQLRLLIRTGRGTDDVFCAWVALRCPAQSERRATP